MNQKRINVARSSMPEFEEYCEEIRDLWDSRFLTNMGSKHLRLEEELRRYLNTPNITLFTNGHLALENILTAMDLPTRCASAASWSATISRGKKSWNG